MSRIHYGVRKTSDPLHGTGTLKSTLACPSTLTYLQSPPGVFACVPFYSAMLVGTRLFIGSRKEQPRIKRLPATWGLGVLEKGVRGAGVLLFHQTSKARLQNGGATTWFLVPRTADSQNLGMALTAGPSPPSSCGCVEGLVFLPSCCSEDLLSRPQRSE